MRSLSRVYQISSADVRKALDYTAALLQPRFPLLFQDVVQLIFII